MAAAHGNFNMGVWTKDNLPVPFHTDLFSRASPVFACLLENHYVLSNGNRKTVLLDIEERLFRIIARVICENALDEGLDVSDLLKLLDAGLQYQIAQLLPLVGRRIRSLTNPVDSLKLLEAARSRELPKMENYALESIIENIVEIHQTDDFKTLGCYDVCRIMSDDFVHQQLTEMQIFEALVRWSEGKAGCSTATNCNKVRRYVAQVKESCRFQSMTLFEFDHIWKLLPEMDAIVWFRHFAITGASAAPKYQPQTGQSYEETVPNSVAATSNVKASLYDEELSTVVKRIDSISAPTFDEMLRRFARSSCKMNISDFHFTNVTLDENYRKLCLESCRSMKLDATCKFIDKPHDMDNAPGKNVMDSSFMRFILAFDPMRYIAFDNRGIEMTPDNIWSLEQDVHLKFNGVTLLRMEHARGQPEQEAVLVLNYVSASRMFLRNHEMKPTKLALSNCEFSMKHLRGRRGKYLESLVLYRAWGEYNLANILKEYPNLKELVCWKHIPSEWPQDSLYCAPLSVNLSTAFTVKSSIRKLVLYEAELKFSLRNLSPATTVQDLWLEMCHVVEGGRNDVQASDVFHRIFPRLENLVILEETTATKSVPNSAQFAISSMMNCVTCKIASIKSIYVIGMKWFYRNWQEDDAFSSFLAKEANVSGKPSAFRIEKTAGVWSGFEYDDAIKESEDVDGGYWSQRDQMEFSWCSLGNFYDSIEHFQDYFIQSEQFPHPILWG